MFVAALMEHFCTCSAHRTSNPRPVRMITVVSCKHLSKLAYALSTLFGHNKDLSTALCHLSCFKGLSLAPEQIPPNCGMQSMRCTLKQTLKLSVVCPAASQPMLMV